eukprot:4447147-Ditylum_brightwellii.AAC.1
MAKECDDQFPQEAEGHTGSFENALRTFRTGGPIPLVFGAFGETNSDTDKFLKVATLTEESTKSGLGMSPVKSMHDSTGACS